MTWAEVSDSDEYRVYYTTAEDFAAGDEPEGLNASSSSSSDTHHTLSEDVVVDTTYRIAVTVVDNHKNESLLSNVVTGTAQQIPSEVGDDEDGCCTVAANHRPCCGFWVLVAVGLVFVRRRRQLGANSGR